MKRWAILATFRSYWEVVANSCTKHSSRPHSSPFNFELHSKSLSFGSHFIVLFHSHAYSSWLHFHTICLPHKISLPYFEFTSTFTFIFNLTFTNWKWNSLSLFHLQLLWFSLSSCAGLPSTHNVSLLLSVKNIPSEIKCSTPMYDISKPTLLLYKTEVVQYIVKAFWGQRGHLICSQWEALLLNWILLLPQVFFCTTLPPNFLRCWLR